MQEAKKVALISGANKGVGFKAVRQIAKGLAGPCSPPYAMKS